MYDPILEAINRHQEAAEAAEAEAEFSGEDWEPDFAQIAEERAEAGREAWENRY